MARWAWIGELCDPRPGRPLRQFPGSREHDLKSVDVDLPRHTLVVFTGDLTSLDEGEVLRRFETLRAMKFSADRPFAYEARYSRTAAMFEEFRAVATTPPSSLSGGGKWEAIHDDMAGYFEIRVQGGGMNHRLFCFLERDARDLG